MKKIVMAGILTTQLFCFVNAQEIVEGVRSKNSVKNTSAGCLPPSSSVVLEINNIRTTIHNGGDMWWDLNGNARYEVPKGSGKQSLFAGALWVGGTDANGQIRASMQKFRQNGSDYYPGPVSSSGSSQGSTTSSVCAAYDRIFSVTRQEVFDYRTWWIATRDNDTALLNSQFPNYTVPAVINDWPGNNNDAGYDFNLAPFYDENLDGVYNPADGDYPNFDLDNTFPCGTSRDMRFPRLYGDICHWYVFNDVGNVHSETGGLPVGIEVRAQAFAFSTNDAVNDMTFNHYEIINRGTQTVYNSYIGIWTDGDLGDPSDDYTGCDVARGLGYFYNGDDMDGDGTGITYGNQPPAVGIDLFEGPYMDSDGNDGPSGGSGCNASINGLNFGDGVNDNERLGMTRFVYFSNTIGTGADQLYNIMQGKWDNGNFVTYGGDGHSLSGTPAYFMFPGDASTDPCGWGTDGVPQSGWSEQSAGNVPGDRRFVMSSGPFTIEPGQVNDMTIGVVWAQATTGGANASVTELLAADDIAQQLFMNCFKLTNTGISNKGMSKIQLFPNPSVSELYVKTEGINSDKSYISVYDTRGNLVFNCVSDNKETKIDISGFPSGVLLIKVRNGNYSACERFVKLKE